MSASAFSTDPAWRARASGLLVPEEISRGREVWPWSEIRELNKVIRMVNARHVSLLLKCEEPGCPAPKLERIDNPDGGFTLRCAHLDRVFTKAI